MGKTKKNLRKTDQNNAVQLNRNSFIGRRGLAFIVDFFVTNRLSIFITGIVYGFMNGGKIQILNGFDGIPAGQIWLLLLSVLITHAFYFVYVPAKITGGATMMQKVMQVTVVKEDGQSAGMKDFIIRYFVGCFLLEGLFYDAFGVMLNGICYGILQLPDIFGKAVYIISAICSLLSLGLAFRDRGRFRLFHDKISKTIVKDMYQKGGSVF